MKGTFILVLLLLLIPFTTDGQSWPGGIHDPSSIVKCDDTYWIFGTGDGIYCMYSRDLITWQAGPTPFTKTEFPSWISNYVHGATDELGNPIFHGGFWAPDIIFMNNQYYLYYSCSEWGSMTSTIGCVTNKTLNPDNPDYGWVDAGFLGIWSPQSGLALNAIDPSVTRGQDGKIWLVYGSFNEQGIVVTEIDSASGKPKTYLGNLPGTSIANSWTGPQTYNYGEGEGASMIYRDGYYYLFYNKGGCCAGIASTYYMVMGRSTNPRGPYYDKAGNPLRRTTLKSGGTIVLKHDNSRGQDDRYFGPGHFGLFRENGVDYVSFHYYDPNGFYPNPAVNNQGGPTLGLAKLVWGTDGWPAISLEFLDQGVYTLENSLSSKHADVLSHTPADNAILYQYPGDSLLDSQKWIFTSLGTGEFTIKNYADPSFYVETGELNTSTSLALTSVYTEGIHQKFRTFSSPSGKIILYPSTRDVAWGTSLPTTSNIKLSLSPVTNQEYLRWFPSRFVETISLSATSLRVDFMAGTDTSIIVNSNGRWTSRVFNSSWLSVDTTGYHTEALLLSFTENQDQSERTSRVYVSTYGGEQVSIIVTQPGNSSTSSQVDTRIKDIITCYPNPAGREIFIEALADGRLLVYNQGGQLVKEFKLMTGNTKLDTSDWTRGVYFFRMVTASETSIKKIVKL